MPHGIAEFLGLTRRRVSAFAHGRSVAEALAVGKYEPESVTIYNDKDCYTFRVYNDLSVSFLHEKGDTEIASEPKKPLRQVQQKIRELGASRWSLYGLFTFQGTIPSGKSLPANHLKTQVTAPAYQLSQSIAYKILDSASVTTLGSTGRILTKNRQSFGSSVLKSCP